MSWLRALSIYMLVGISATVYGHDVAFTNILERLEALEHQGQACTEALVNQDERHAAEMAAQGKLIAELRSLVDKQAARIDILEAEMGQVTGLREMTINPENETAAAEKTVKDARSRRVLYEGPVAFQAEVAKQEATHIAIGQKVPFDSVMLNVGGGYNQQQNLFVAPESGIYIFSVSIMSDYKPHNEIWVGIYKNGQRLAGAFAFGDISRDQGSVTAVAQLAVGDQVWVSLNGLADDSLWGHGFTSFMGCMVMYA